MTALPSAVFLQVKEWVPLVGKTKKTKSEDKFYSDEEDEKDEDGSESSGSEDSSSSSSSSGEGLFSESRFLSSNADIRYNYYNYDIRSFMHVKAP